jgi:RNase P subunit RPR2
MSLLHSMTTSERDVERWVCEHCGRTLGVVRGSTVEITVRRRVITAHLPCAQICGDCGRQSIRAEQSDQWLATRQT